MQSSQRSFQYLKNTVLGAMVFLETLKRTEALFLRKRNDFFLKNLAYFSCCCLLVYVYPEGLGLY